MELCYNVSACNQVSECVYFRKGGFPICIEKCLLDVRYSPILAQFSRPNLA